MKYICHSLVIVVSLLSCGKKRDSSWFVNESIPKPLELAESGDSKESDKQNKDAKSKDQKSIQAKLNFPDVTFLPLSGVDEIGEQLEELQGAGFLYRAVDEADATAGSMLIEFHSKNPWEPKNVWVHLDLYSSSTKEWKKTSLSIGAKDLFFDKSKEIIYANSIKFLPESGSKRRYDLFKVTRRGLVLLSDGVVMMNRIYIMNHMASSKHIRSGIILTPVNLSEAGLNNIRPNGTSLVKR